MSVEEHLDYYDENQKWLGIASRAEVHQRGLWHKTFHCWVLSYFEGEKYIIFQKRNAQKQTHPNKYDISAAGHITAGESLEEGARELNEELGLDFRFQDLKFLGVNTDVAVIDGKWINREFCYTYFLRYDSPLSQYHLQQSELAGVVQVPLSDAINLVDKKVNNIEVEGVFWVENELQLKEVSLSLEDLLPHSLHYYLKVFIMAERYLDGADYVAI